MAERGRATDLSYSRLGKDDGATSHRPASKTLQFMAGRLSTAPTPRLVRIAKNRLVQQVVAREVQKYLLNKLKASRSDPSYLPSIQDDRIAMGIASRNRFIGASEESISRTPIYEGCSRS
jgi:hypothetical protein